MLAEVAQITFENVSDDNLPVETPHVTLQVNQRADLSLEILIIANSDRAVAQDVIIPAHQLPDANQMWQQLHVALGSAVRLGELSDVGQRSIWLHMKSLGKEIHDFFVTGSLRSASLEWQPGTVISIETNEKWIPWELVFDVDSGEFWGSKFIVARRPVVTGIEGFRPPTSRKQRAGEAIHIEKTVNVIGGGLPHDIADSARRLFAQAESGCAVSICEGADLTIADLETAFSDADLIHFTCHGHLEPLPCLQLGSQAPTAPLGILGCLQPSNICLFSIRPQSIVFANACSSVHMGTFLDRTRSFGWEFFLKGVDAYIGTLGMIPTKYAVAFAEAFYEQFLHGATAGAALQYAKANSAHNNPFWLLYCLYGDPFARRVAMRVDRHSEQ